MVCVSSISAVWTRKHTPTGVRYFQRVSPTNVLNRFGEFPLICFIWVYVCVCIDDLKSRKGGWDVGGGRDTVIRSGPLTSLCADKAGHTHTHSDSHSRTSKTDNTPQCYLPVALFLWVFFSRAGVSGFIGADPLLHVYKRSSAHFILMKAFPQKQDIYWKTWLLLITDISKKLGKKTDHRNTPWAKKLFYSSSLYGNNDFYLAIKWYFCFKLNSSSKSGRNVITHGSQAELFISMAETHPWQGKSKNLERCDKS